MKRFLVAALLTAAVTAPARAETIVYEFAALPGDAVTCQWFDDNVNERSIDAIIHQTDLLYNRVALRPDVPVTVLTTATTANDKQEVGFVFNGRHVCSSIEALTPNPPPPTTP